MSISQTDPELKIGTSILERSVELNGEKLSWSRREEWERGESGLARLWEEEGKQMKKIEGIDWDVLKNGRCRM